MIADVGKPFVGIEHDYLLAKLLPNQVKWRYEVRIPTDEGNGINVASEHIVEHIGCDVDIRPFLFQFDNMHSAVGGLAAKDRILVVPAHPDDLIPCFGTCLLSKDIFEWHVIEFTHGERGMGREGFEDGMHSMLLAKGNVEGFMSFVQPLQGQGKTIFQELPPPKRNARLRFQGTRKLSSATTKSCQVPQRRDFMI